LLLVCAAILVTQLFVPPTVGLADNGDFSKVYTRFSLSHIRGSVDNFAYFAPMYWFSPDPANPSPLSSEAALAAAPIWIGRAAKASLFDVRWLGALHALLFLGAYYALLVHMRPWNAWRRLVLGLAALWIFGDVAYVAYCNSFFADTAALLGALLMIPLAFRAATSKRPGEATIFFLALGAVLFIASGPRHVAVGLIPAVVVLWVLRRRLLALLLVGALWAAATSVPQADRARPLFNLIFNKISKRSVTPQQDLTALGLSAQDVQYIGMSAGDPRNPAGGPFWVTTFLHRTGYGKVAWFYVTHPLRTVHMLIVDLHLEGFQIRPPALGNFRREDGFPPGALAHHFDSWSRLRTGIYIRWWWHRVVWYVLFLGLGIRLARRSRTAGVAVGVALMAIAEFAIASLADGAETYRHLLLFHLLSDVTILIAAGWLLSSTLSHATHPDTAVAQSDLLPASS
jgi:hypothetical protein